MSFDSSNKFNSVGLGGLYLFIYKVWRLSCIKFGHRQISNLHKKN